MSRIQFDLSIGISVAVYFYMLENFECYQLAKELYRDSLKLSFVGEIKIQFDRAILSVVLNLAEGTGKTTNRERTRFYSIALGSLREVQAIYDISGEKVRYEKANKLGAMIYRLIQNPS